MKIGITLDSINDIKLLFKLQNKLRESKLLYDSNKPVIFGKNLVAYKIIEDIKDDGTIIYYENSDFCTIGYCSSKQCIVVETIDGNKLEITK